MKLKAKSHHHLVKVWTLIHRVIPTFCLHGEIPVKRANIRYPLHRVQAASQLVKSEDCLNAVEKDLDLRLLNKLSLQRCLKHQHLSQEVEDIP